MLVYVCNRWSVQLPFALFRRSKEKAFQSLLSLPLQRYGIKVEKQTISTILCAKVLFSNSKVLCQLTFSAVYYPGVTSVGAPSWIWKRR